MNQIVSDVVSCQNQIDWFFVNQRIALLLKQSNIAKKFGISPVVVIRFIFSLVFTGKNLFRYLHTPESVSDIGKDTVYRFLNSTTANWRKFLHAERSSNQGADSAVNFGQDINLNELEYIRGQIHAVVWMSDRIVRIDPASGSITTSMTLQHLYPPEQRPSEEADLNGIAYDPDGDRIFVTGKLWPQLFEIKLREKLGAAAAHTGGVAPRLPP